MGMTPEDWEAWWDEQESQQETTAFVKEIVQLSHQDWRAVDRALASLPREKKNWKPSRADIEKGILTYADLVVDTLRRAVEGGNSPTVD